MSVLEYSLSDVFLEVRNGCICEFSLNAQTTSAVMLIFLVLP